MKNLLKVLSPCSLAFLALCQMPAQTSPAMQADEAQQPTTVRQSVAGSQSATERPSAEAKQSAEVKQPPASKQSIDLPTSKQLLEPVPGSPAKLNSLPMAFAFSPDGRYLAVLNAGYGTFESQYQQSIALLDRKTGKLADFPDARTASSLPQILYAGLAFSGDGTHLYASFDSLSEPEGDGAGKTGNAIAVYTVKDGAVAPERLIPVPLQQLSKGKVQNPIGHAISKGRAIPAPAGLAVVKNDGGNEELLIADELSDDALLIDTVTGKVIHRYDLSDKPTVPANFPIAVAASRDGRRGFVALWNGSAIVELDLKGGKVLGKLALLPPQRVTSASSHPTAFAFSPDEKALYVALANRDAIAVVNLSGDRMKMRGLLDASLPGQSYFGAMPAAVAVSPDGRRVYAANTGSNAIAVFDSAAMAQEHSGIAVKAIGFIPTEWYPTAVAVAADPNSSHGSDAKSEQIYVATAKGKGTGPNVEPQPEAAAGMKHSRSPHTYIATLLYGSLATIDRSGAERDLKQLTDEVLVSNRQKAAAEHVVFQQGSNRIRHVIYIIKENRTYDQIFGDLRAGNGDPSLTMYGRSVTPNQHKLAEQFGVIDNFYDSGEVSGDGHVWSNAAITTDYTEKQWQQAYRGKERTYDFEGVNEEGYPLKEGIPDINEPRSGYLWTNLARAHKSYYHFGEYVSTKFCDDSGEAPKTASPTEGTPEPSGAGCKRAAIKPGEAIPDNYGGGKSGYPWSIPLVLNDVATKPELEGHFDPQYPDFNLSFPDQLRVDEFLTFFRPWVVQREAGRDDMPEFISLRLPNDHTAGTRVGMPTPKASVADNDLAVGRVVDAVSHSPYWNDTAFFILEDDAQDGADHVDAHRSTALVVSKYAPLSPVPAVHHDFYTTVSVIHTMEDLLGLPPMNNNDAFAPLMAPLFAGAGDQPAFNADMSNKDNGLIYQANGPKAVGARESARMDFSHADQADSRVLNVILWRDAMGDKPVPATLAKPYARRKDADGD